MVYYRLRKYYRLWCACSTLMFGFQPYERCLAVGRERHHRRLSVHPSGPHLVHASRHCLSPQSGWP